MKKVHSSVLREQLGMGLCWGSAQDMDLSRSLLWLSLTLGFLLFQGLIGNPGEHGLKGDKVI